MSEFDYDLFVIGAGSGGVRAARMAAAAGAKVAIAEDTYLGGTCVNAGCVPKKLFVYASHYSEDFQDAAGYGWHTPQSPQFDWQTLRESKNLEIKRLNNLYAELLHKAGVTLMQGKAKLVDPQSVAVDKHHYRCKTILLATGARPFVPELPGAEHCLTSDEIFHLAQFPKRVLIVGGGYVAVEFASIFAGLGAQTHLIYRNELFLRDFDQDIREFMAAEMTKKGVKLHFRTDALSVVKNADGSLAAQLDGATSINADLILMATGRRPRIEGLGLERLGVQLAQDGAVLVNDKFQTNVPSIYAIGDLVGRRQLTPIAIAEAMALVEHLYKGSEAKLDYDLIPTAVFCQPTIATVGLSEEEARLRYPEVAVYRSEFRPLKYSLTKNPERSLMKLVVDSTTDKVLGAHMVGPEAGEIIQGVAIAMKAGATKAVFDQTLGIHPTAAEEFVTMRTSTR